MSNALAIASVTAVLKDLLNNGVIDHDLPSVVGSDVAVTALPPDRIEVEGPSAQSQLNLFLYQVTPNQGWRNNGLPSRDSRGQRTANPPLALNLHYLLTAYGVNEFHSEILLGYGMQLLHENGVLTRDAVRTALAPPTPVGAGLPAELSALSTSQLAEQVELIKLTLEQMNTEEISKLWTAFQAKYRPSAAYQASVVLIENDQPTRSSLPVQARNLYVRTFRQPVIGEIRSQAGPGDPVVAGQPILPGYRLVILGSQLRGDDTLVRVGAFEIVPDDAEVSSSQIIVPLPPDLPAGVHGAQVLHRIFMGAPPEPHLGMESNVCPFVLRPEITAPVSIIDSSTAADGTISATVEISVNPAVEDSRRVVLLLNEFRPDESPPVSSGLPHSYRFARPAEAPGSPSGPFATITIPIAGVEPGDYLIRIQVDGAESLLETNADGRFNAPQVAIS
ncbi:MAG TPA: DUF4255 domain-containing protein [Verrucomicrobiales bacterium]|nr:DUF4255 domain-containing protein [Verrucomicrobiales bacterium]